MLQLGYMLLAVQAQCMDGIVSCITALLGSIISVVGVSFTLRYYKYKDKKEKRGLPTVAIWSDKVDDIDARLNREYRWFLTKDNLDVMINKPHIYFCLQSRKNELYNARISFFMDQELIRNKSIAVGTLFDQDTNAKVIPIQIASNIELVNLGCNIEFDTDEEEQMEYHVEVKYNCKHNQFYDRKDKLLLCKTKTKYTKCEKGKKVVKELEYAMMDSYSSVEVKKWLGNNKLSKGGGGDGDYSTSK